MPTTYDMTILFADDQFRLLVGPPSDYDLSPTAAFTFNLDDDTAVFWTVNCELTPEQIQILAAQLLSNFGNNPVA